MKKLLNGFKKKRLKGITIIEVTIVVVVMLIIAVGGVSSYASSINKAKMAMLLNDFASLKVASSQMMYENSGLGSGRIDANDFYKFFNQYIDSNCSLSDDNKTLLKNDPWDSPYQVRFVQVSKSETKIFVDSTGKSSKLDYTLLIHYKNGEVRVGTAGFDNNEGSDTSDAAKVDGVASITNMWAK